MAATAEVMQTNEAAAQAAPAPAVVKPAAKAAPAAQAEPKPEVKEKPKAKAGTHTQGPAADRETTVAKFARLMNADAEKDGVEVDAPPTERRAKPGPKPGAKRTPAPAATSDEVEKPAPVAKEPPRPSRVSSPTRRMTMASSRRLKSMKTRTPASPNRAPRTS